MQVERCFGFDTAVEQSQHALMAAKVESCSAYQGIGLVKLMGRQSGFVAVEASMASGAKVDNPESSISFFIAVMHSTSILGDLSS